ncbi:MAG: hypothetical protein E6J02_06665 [Chloroflexi bacterium]|nr:MAG: hypothetical protein E6J02_06665 [Chloroflexota bacterium]
MRDEPAEPGIAPQVECSHLKQGGRLTPEVARLGQLWRAHLSSPPLAGRRTDTRRQEIALFESWLGSIVEAVLERTDGTLSPAHARLLAIREAEGNQEIWAAAGELGEPARAYVARLLAIQELLSKLPRER